MKPGVAISTPDVAVLEQRYADLIPKPAPADPVPVVATQSRKQEETRKQEENGPRNPETCQNQIIVLNGNVTRPALRLRP